MDFNTLLEKSYIKNLKCSNCKNYLSYFPIFLTTNNLSICGRCHLPKDNICTRNEIYEIIASETHFPCRYIENGCIDKLCPKDIKSHEKICRFRKVQCPADKIVHCKEVMPLPDLEQHCMDTHSDIILINGKFKLDLSKSEESSHILINNNEFFTFRIKFDAESYNFTYNVSYFEKNVAFSISYEIFLENDMRNCTLKNFISDSQKEANLLILKDPMDTKVTGKITFQSPKSETTSDRMSKELLQILKCCKCSMYIKPPITVYFHNEKPYCTLCGSKTDPFASQTTFYGLDDLVQKLNYPCQNEQQGCMIKLPPADITNHEMYCQYSQKSCSVQVNCTWKGRDIFKHLEEKHRSLFAKSDLIVEYFNRWDNHIKLDKTHIIKFANHYFLLNFSAYNPNFYWTVQMMEECQEKFCYKLELGDGVSKKLVIVQSVLPPIPTNQLFKNPKEYCYYRLDQIKNVKDGGSYINYNIHIFKL